MYDKTTSVNFKRYGTIYDEAKDMSNGKLIKKQIVTGDKVVSSLYNFYFINIFKLAICKRY